MREEIKELCIFMICGQTLLYFQSGKKYEKICRMILELLVLAGIVGMILNFLQSMGIQKGEMQALGGAVTGMQRSMEEAVGRQLDMEGIGEEFLSGISMESLVEKYTMEEVKRQYGYFAEQYGFEIEKAEQAGDGLRVYVRESAEQGTAESAEKGRDAGETAGMAGSAGREAGIEKQAESAENAGKAAGIERQAEGAEIQQVEIQKIETGKVRLGESAGADEPNEITDESSETDISNKITNEKADGGSESGSIRAEAGGNQLEAFRRQFALVLAMEEEKLEVILVD